MNKASYPSTNYQITTRTFRKIVTTYSQTEAPEMAEGIASLLSHDVTTAKKYYDVNRGVSAARRTQRIRLKKWKSVRRGVNLRQKHLTGQGVWLAPPPPP